MMRVLPLLGLVAAGAAIAAPPGAERSIAYVQAGTSAEGLPDYFGADQLRLRHDIAVGALLHPRWRFDASGNLENSSLDEADLYRLGLRYAQPDLSAALGRQVRVGSDGLMRLDGATVDVLSSKPVNFSVWGGRIGHPEPLVDVTAYGAGTEVRWNPRGKNGIGWSGVSTAGGYQWRLSPDQTVHRFHVTGALTGPTGANLSTLVQLGLSAPTDDAPEEEEAETGIRAQLRGNLPMGKVLTLSEDARWEGLSRAAVPETTYGVIQTLAPDGYGISETVLAIRPGKLHIRLAGGPTFTPQGEEMHMGGAARCAMEVGPSPGNVVGVFARGATLGTSAYAGGGLAGARQVGPADLQADFGAYQMQVLDGEGSLAYEGRFIADLLIPRSVSIGGLKLRLMGGMGSDRLMTQWVRAGAALHGSLYMNRKRAEAKP